MANRRDKPAGFVSRTSKY